MKRFLSAAGVNFNTTLTITFVGSLESIATAAVRGYLLKSGGNIFAKVHSLKQKRERRDGDNLPIITEAALEMLVHNHTLQ